MNIAIVEDDATDREYLLDCLSMFADDTHTAVSISTFSDADAFLGDGSPTRYDLLFLDIYMGNTTGMDLARRLRQGEVRGQIVFVTSSQTHAVASYEVAATYYLLKPYQYDQFSQMMQVVLAKVVAETEAITVKVGHNMEKVPIQSILYVDYDDHYVQLHTATRVVRTYAAFAEIAAQLQHYPQFLTCYRNMMVNMDRVEKLGSDCFTLEQGASVPIMRGHVREMREAYTAYLFARMKRGSAT